MDTTTLQSAVNLLNGWVSDCNKLINENEKLLTQLPDGMKDCAIVYKQCSKGHGWLTATNWVQHPCPICELEKLKQELAIVQHNYQQVLRNAQ